MRFPCFCSRRIRIYICCRLDQWTILRSRCCIRLWNSTISPPSHHEATKLHWSSSCKYYSVFFFCVPREKVSAYMCVCVWVCAYACAHISIIPIISFPTYPNVTTSFLQMSSCVRDLWKQLWLLCLHTCTCAPGFCSLRLSACTLVLFHRLWEHVRAGRSWGRPASSPRSQWCWSRSSEGQRLPHRCW